MWLRGSWVLGRRRCPLPEATVIVDWATQALDHWSKRPYRYQNRVGQNRIFDWERRERSRGAHHPRDREDLVLILGVNWVGEVRHNRSTMSTRNWTKMVIRDPIQRADSKPRVYRLEPTEGRARRHRPRVMKKVWVVKEVKGDSNPVLVARCHHKEKRVHSSALTLKNPATTLSRALARTGNPSSGRGGRGGGQVGQSVAVRTLMDRDKTHRCHIPPQCPRPLGEYRRQHRAN